MVTKNVSIGQPNKSNTKLSAHGLFVAIALRGIGCVMAAAIYFDTESYFGDEEVEYPFAANGVLANDAFAKDSVVNSSEHLGKAPLRASG